MSPQSVAQQAPPWDLATAPTSPTKADRTQWKTGRQKQTHAQRGPSWPWPHPYPELAMEQSRRLPGLPNNLPRDHPPAQGLFRLVVGGRFTWGSRCFPHFFGIFVLFLAAVETIYSVPEARNRLEEANESLPWLWTFPPTISMLGMIRPARCCARLTVNL